MSLLSDQALGVCLTARELEVLALVAGGLSAKEIALRIAIAPRTVERHIDNARLKMRARNRTHLVTRAIASGLLDPPEREEEAQVFPPVLLRGQHTGAEAILLL
ncbi:response regulator transcription factor [uncultured Sphingomonas sp.]|uniref:response regulator transcription factor n=1 Tax=uncultured Sphingomonas sp. TaxID=158754 RepID=UPI00261E4413|nr:helix-turn-helix transcriptional regulator [uncultured Sphingomonas sp.]